MKSKTNKTKRTKKHTPATVEDLETTTNAAPIIRKGLKEARELEPVPLELTENEMQDISADGLEQKQIRFCQYYVNLQNPQQASILAGYEKTYGYKLLTRPEIKVYLAKLNNFLVEKCLITREYQLERLESIYETASRFQTYFYTNWSEKDRMEKRGLEYKPEERYAFGVSEIMLKVIEIQNKMLGFDKPKQDEPTADEHITINL